MCESAIEQPETVLLVVDDPNLRTAVDLGLARLGYRVVAAADHDDALAQFRGHKNVIDLVILDVATRGRTGLDVYRGLIAEKPDVKVILTSDHFRPTGQRQIRELNVLFLARPYTLGRLGQAIRQLLDG